MTLKKNQLIKIFSSIYFVLDNVYSQELKYSKFKLYGIKEQKIILGECSHNLPTGITNYIFLEYEDPNGEVFPMIPEHNVEILS